MAYTPTVYANDNPPALNADNLNKAENELAKLDQQGEDLFDTQNAIDSGYILQDIKGYLWQRGKFFDSNLNLITNAAVNTYKIPVSFPTFVCFDWTGNALGLSTAYVVTFEASGVYDRTDYAKYVNINTTKKKAIIIPKANTTAIYISFSEANIGDFKVYVGNSGFGEVDNYKRDSLISVIKENNAVNTIFWINSSGNIDTLSGVNVFWKKVNSGDKIKVNSVSGVSVFGGFVKSDRTVTIFNSTQLFECTSDGIIYLIDSSSNSVKHTYYPKNSYSVNTDNIDGFENGVKNVLLSKGIFDKINNIKNYLYAENAYFSSGNLVSLNGYNVYKIPVEAGMLIHLYSANQTLSSLNQTYKIQIELTDNTFITGATNTLNIYTDIYFIMCVAPSNAKYAYLSIKSDGEFTFDINTKYQNSLKDSPYVESGEVVKDVLDYGVQSKLYPSGNTYSRLSGDYVSRIFRVKDGDSVQTDSLITGLSFYGMLLKDDGTTVRIDQGSYEFEDDGWAFIFNNTSTPVGSIYNPDKQIKLDYNNLINVPEIPVPESRYNGLNAVAFGTSLTYRAQTTQGYLNFLPGLSGMTIDNQGLGSSTILEYSSMPKMLPVIKNYASYLGKRICILEGFVNDWFYNSDRLGTWKDTAETTVCGCVRSALNYIISQNVNITVFLVLDHYGKLYSGTDCRSTAVRGEGLPTQYEFYEEIAKVANSLGIPVIKQYANSEISENTPQYLGDNIHPTLLGAKQSAYSIWEKMQTYYPNQV